MLGLSEVGAFSGEHGRVSILDAGRATLELSDPAHADYIDEVEVGSRVDCTPPARVSTGATYGGSVQIGADRTFALEGSGDGITVKFSGTFAADGSTVAGRFQIHVSFDYQGTHYECDSGGADWSAKWQG